MIFNCDEYTSLKHLLTTSLNCFIFQVGKVNKRGNGISYKRSFIRLVLKWQNIEVCKTCGEDYQFLMQYLSLCCSRYLNDVQLKYVFVYCTRAIHPYILKKRLLNFQGNSFQVKFVCRSVLVGNLVEKRCLAVGMC